MITASITVSGIPELRAKLDPLTFGNVLRTALLDALQPTVSAVGAAAPRKTGRLAGSIAARIGRGSSLSARIVSGTGYGHLVDRGHRIVVGGKISRAQTARGKLRAAQKGTFTGHVIGRVAAHPFVLAVVAATESEIARIMDQHIQRLLAA